MISRPPKSDLDRVSSSSFSRAVTHFSDDVNGGKKASVSDQEWVSGRCVRPSPDLLDKPAAGRSFKTNQLTFDRHAE